MNGFWRLISMSAVIFAGSRTTVLARHVTAPQQSDTPVEVILDNEIRIAFEDVIENEDGTSLWLYTVEELPEAKDLKYWVLEIPDCASILNADPEPWQDVYPDEGSGLSGIRWDVDREFPAGTFGVTLEGQLIPGTRQVAAKAAPMGRGEITGPECAVVNLPIANPDNYAVDQDTTLGVATLSGLLINDEPGEGGTLTANLSSGPTNGTLQLEVDGSFVYEPQAGFIGQDIFSYTALEGENESVPATVTIDVLDPQGPPEANDDSYETEGGTALSVAAPGVLENDGPGSGGNLEAVLVEPPAQGMLELNGDGSFTFTPAVNFYGVETFQYLARRNSNDSPPAMVTIKVLDLAPPTVTWTSPVASGETFEVEDEFVVLEVASEDNDAVSTVIFQRWDAVREVYVTIAILDQAPYRVEIDPIELNLAWNQVYAIALDPSGNESIHEYIWLYRVGMTKIFLPLANKGP